MGIFVNIQKKENGVFRRISNEKQVAGYVKIKFLNTKGHILKSDATAVNNSKPLEPDENSLFAYRTFKMHFRGVVDFNVVFIGVEIKETKEPISQVLR